MISRRAHLRALAALTATVLSGCDMTTRKKHINTFGKTFEYLTDANLRKKEKGDSLIMVEGAEISGTAWQGVEWNNIFFKNCDFVGAYQLKPKSLSKVRFEDCRFSGIFSYGVATDIHFLRCGWAAESVAFAQEGSKAVVFEECRFVGATADPNHRGGVGSDGEARFVRCKAKWFVWGGYEKLELIECELDDCEISTDSMGNSGENFLYSTTSVERCALRGTFDMRAVSLQSLTIRDTTIGTLDLSNATVKGDILLERISGGCIQAGIKEGAGTFTLRDSQIMGNGERVCNVYAGAFQDVRIENVVFGSVEGQPVGIGGGYKPDEKNPQPTLTRSVTFKNVKARSLRSARLNASLLRLENVEVNEANFKEGRINALEFDGARFVSLLDLTATQVKELRQTGGTDIKMLGRALKLDGSNIKLAR